MAMADVSDGRVSATELGPSTSVLTWVSHPLRQAHKKTALLVVVVGLTSLLIGWNTESVMWGVISAFILLLGVYDFIFPTHYRLTSVSAETRVLVIHRRKTWSVIRSYHPDPNGVLLSPFPTRSRLETFRGLYIRFADNRDEVLDFVRERLEERQ
jgi:hypothetical protein